MRTRFSILAVLVLAVGLLAGAPVASAHHWDGYSPIIPFGSDHHGGETIQASVGDTLEFGSRWGACTRGLAQGYARNAEVAVWVDGVELEPAGWSRPINPDDSISSFSFEDGCTPNAHLDTGWWVFWKAPFTFTESGIYTVTVEVTHTEDVHDGAGTYVEAGDTFWGEVFIEVGLVTMVGPYGADSAEGIALLEELSGFAAEGGFEVVYDQYLDNEDLADRIFGVDPPDVIIAPFLGFLAEVADQLVDLAEFVEPDELDDAFGDYLVESATAHDGAVLGAPIRVTNLKTLVWYKPEVFAAAGYAIPTTFAELVALSDRMVADGETPWCNFIESDTATGWVGTDWIEDLLLGGEGPEVYDQWVDHSVLFTDARVEVAFERYRQMIDTAGYVHERANMLNISFQDNASPLDAGDCLMHRQATFFGVFLHMAGADLDDYATFKFPSVDPTLSEAAMSQSADYVAALDDRPEVEQLTEFMLSDEFGESTLAATGSWLLPNTGFDHSFYEGEMVRSWADILREGIRADLFRFDASDLMPGEVGAGTFWTGIVDLVEGEDIPTILADIDASWPS